MTDRQNMPAWYRVKVPPASGLGVTETLIIENRFNREGAFVKSVVIHYSHGVELASRE